MGEQPGNAECAKDAQQDQPQQQRSRADGAAESAAGGEEQGDAGNHGGKSAVAGDEIVGEDGDEPFPWRINDAASGHAGGVAAESHAHGEALLAAGTGTLKGTVQVKRHTWQIPEVLQQCEQGKEDRHGRQHHGNDPGQHGVYAVQEKAFQPAVISYMAMQRVLNSDVIP